MPLLDNLVDLRRQRLENLRSNNNNNNNDNNSNSNKEKKSSILPNIIDHTNDDLLTKDTKLENNSSGIQNPNKNYETDDEDQKKEEEPNGQPVSVTRDFEIRLDSQLKVLESRTNLALKRILRRQMFQKDLNEEDIGESDKIKESININT
ncbi:uncharacterized protein PWA37_002271 [Arxiozyma heterogenica]|uniref:Uncharacterized protein n=1 Tax=Arxiozyma heterogenica TaxID=278026 RepID=A0AAN7WGA7_9SACH|nr:hypothetical protein RI543_003650 [Kazachstania heterogenica]